MAHLPHSTERGRETLRLLREALIELVAENGFDAVTIKDITERAGVDRTTFYLHAADKRDLFERSQRQVIDDVFASAAASGPGERIHAAFHHLAEHAATYRVLLTVTDPVFDQRLQAYIAEQVGQAIVSRGGRQDLSVGLLATYAAAVLRALARWWLERDMPYTPDDMAAITARLITGGFAAYGA